MKVLKEFTGFSGSVVKLMDDSSTLFVRKEGNVERNLERYRSLSGSNLPFPYILREDKLFYDMEYIKNIDMLTYLKIFGTGSICDFIISIVSSFDDSYVLKDYSDIYDMMLDKVPWQDFSFGRNELFINLPKHLPCGKYHGDFSLDNFLYDTDKERFVLIDPITSCYDSYVFDLAKLNQDIKCGWFSRNDLSPPNDIIKSVFENLSKRYAVINNNYLTIMMLFRIIPYCKNECDYNFIVKSVEKLWKS